MSETSLNETPLISVIIPSYNHGRYILEAIKSVNEQGYHNHEVVVVDDGSTDNTKAILKDVTDVKYIYQNNQGLSAARNTGIKNSAGEYLIFLDADDWLLPGAIAKNVAFIKQRKQLAFVSGAHQKVFVDTGEIIDETSEVTENHFSHLLQGNYIGMHATVIYSRWVFDQFLFDVNLKACEDYDLYLKLARKFPVAHHNVMIAAYRIHTTNMSGNIPMMLHTVLQVLQRQKKVLFNKEEELAFKNGKRVWKEYYCSLLYKRLLSKTVQLNINAFSMLVKYQPRLALKYFLKR